MIGAMHRYDPARRKLALGLAFLAGQVDATGFVAAGGYFSSFMSGNTTRLGVELVAHPLAALLPLTVIGCFVTGVASGAMIALRWPGRHKRLLLAAVAALLGAAALVLGLNAPMAFLGLAALAMGAANNVFSRDGEVTVGVTYMTGALVRSGQGLAARLLGRPMEGLRGYPLLWLSLACGAVAGALLCAVQPVVSAWAGFALAAVLFLAAMRIERSPA